MGHKGESRRPRHRFPRVEETSAGGLVVADYGVGEPSAVLIGRMDRRGSGRLLWSIPKGHIEAGETPEQAAVREITEETGIVGEVLAPLGSIAFWFVEDGRRIHKTVHHFLLRPLGGALSTADHEVAEVAWVPLPEAVDRLCHADERELAVRASGLLAERHAGSGRPHSVTRLPAADHAAITGEGTPRAARRAPEPPARGSDGR